MEQISQTINWTKDDAEAERGELDPPGEDEVYTKGVLNILGYLYRDKKFRRPRGTKMPTFNPEELQAITTLIFFKPPHIVLKVYERIPQETGLKLKRKVFLKHYLADAKFNGARAARMAGYSPRSAKQIAYKIIRGG